MPANHNFLAPPENPQLFCPRVVKMMAQPAKQTVFFLSIQAVTVRFKKLKNLPGSPFAPIAPPPLIEHFAEQLSRHAQSSYQARYRLSVAS
ncbi:MAG: hypothetical protein Q7J74_12605, partial [Pseudomonas sp.]|nr:hypothetical protein [Pseudomonas sp.]